MLTEIRNTHCLVAMVTMTALFTMAPCEIFTSSLKVHRMVEEEQQLLDLLQSYVDKEKEKLQAKYKFITDRFHDINKRQLSESRPDLQHPNSVFNTIKQYAWDYYNVLGNNYDNFMKSVKTSPNMFLSDGDDIKGARLSLLRLQAVYKLDPLDMARGDYLGFQGPPLHPQDVYEIGQAAFTEGKFNESLQWLNASFTMYKSQEYNDTYQPMKMAGIKALMGRIYVVNGKIEMAKEMLNEARKINYTHGDVKELVRELRDGPSFVGNPYEESFHNYSRLCRLGDRHYPAEPNNPKILCRYREALLPYNRFKEEILSLDPFASVIYNVTTDAETESFKSFVKNKLRRGLIEVKEKDKFTNVITNTRTGDLAWISDVDSEAANQLSKKISYITGLNTDFILPDGPSSAEPLQVVNYGLGGHYDVHMDQIFSKSLPTLQKSGMRIATFLIYLSDVTKGGATVFTRAGVAVAPVKHMALLWYNMTPDDQHDTNTFHAGCPVLIGNKWIANKWIWTYGNIFRRRCGLTPDAKQVDIEEDMRRGYK